MTPEETARTLATRLLLAADWRSERVEAALTQALRECREEALEEAAQHIEGRWHSLAYSWRCGQVLKQVAAEIRALKEQQ